jgi:hypothetical protein
VDQRFLDQPVSPVLPVGLVVAREPDVGEPVTSKPVINEPDIREPVTREPVTIEPVNHQAHQLLDGLSGRPVRQRKRKQVAFEGEDALVQVRATRHRKQKRTG